MNLIDLQILTWPSWYAWITFGFIGIIIFSVFPFRIFLTGGFISILTGVLTSIEILTDGLDRLLFFAFAVFVFHYALINLINLINLIKKK